MRLILLCNYVPDAQQSMLRFGGLLEQAWSHRGFDVHVLRPEATWLARAARHLPRGISKWVGYFDKYIAFPRRLSLQLSALEHGKCMIHVVDHSNAVYVPVVKRSPWIVTCHDLLAVRGALGEDTDCPASVLGRQLQRAVVAGLSRASAIVADSTSTLHDLNRVVSAPQSQARRVIHLALNYPFRPRTRAEALSTLSRRPTVAWERPFIIHVGSNLPRKNKCGVLRVFARLANGWSGNLVFAGSPITAELSEQAANFGLPDRLFAAPTLSDSELEAAYSLAHALVFPSKCEGFGWPVIEAQACGCPVVCSDRTSLPEIAGDAALVHALADEAGMADAVMRLAEPSFRRDIVARGFANLRRFELNEMLDRYHALYDAAIAAFDLT